MADYLNTPRPRNDAPMDLQANCMDAVDHATKGRKPGDHFIMIGFRDGEYHICATPRAGGNDVHVWAMLSQAKNHLWEHASNEDRAQIIAAETLRNGADKEDAATAAYSHMANDLRNGRCARERAEFEEVFGVADAVVSDPPFGGEPA